MRDTGPRRVTENPSLSTHLDDKDLATGDDGCDLVDSEPEDDNEAIDGTHLLRDLGLVCLILRDHMIIGWIVVDFGMY